MTFYERLVAEVATEREALLAIPIIQDGMRGNLSKETYIGYLSEAYHFVKHTVPLVETVQARLAADRFALHDALSDFALEKKGHEKWILHDIKAAGSDADKVRDSAPSKATEEFLAYAYETARQVNPVGFFGMIYVIEGTGAGIASATAGKLMASLDLPPKCFSYLLSHGSMELDDMDFFEVLMAQITDAAEQDAIIQMAKRMYCLYGKIFENIALQTGFSPETD